MTRLLLARGSLPWRYVSAQRSQTASVVQERGYSAGLQQSTPTPGSSAGASLLFGKALGSVQLVQQSSAILAKVHVKQASPRQLVEVLEQLAPLGRHASAKDLQELSETRTFRQLLAEIVRYLPRDAGEKVSWEAGWTSRVAAALRDLRVQGVDPQLCHRLGHALVQAAPEGELSALLHTACDLCTADGLSLAPDDYALWVLGGKLEELCQESELGKLGMDQLVPLLHLLAHPAVRGRVMARSSPSVLRHVHHGLPSCRPSDIAKLLQAYSDVPAIVIDGLQALVAHSESESGSGPASAQLLLSLSLPELTVVASALPTARVGVPSQEPGQANEELAALGGLLSTAVLRRLDELLDVDKALDLELSVTCALAATSSLGASNESGQAPLRGLLRKLGMRAAASTDADRTQPIAAETLAQILLLALQAERAESRLQGPVVEASSGGQWMSAAAAQLAPRSGELSSTLLTELVEALAASELAMPASLIEALGIAAVSHAPKLPLDQFCSLAQAFAQAGTLDEDFLEAADLDARLSGARPLSPQGLARVAWAMAASGNQSSSAWPLVSAQLLSMKTECLGMSGQDRARLLEALSAHAALTGEAWPKGSAAEQVVSDPAWQSNWRQQAARTLLYQDKVADLLQDLDVKFERDAKGEDGLYVIPILLPGEKTVIDLLTDARHPASRQPRGDVALRHQVWSASGYSVLAIPDSVWPRIGGATEAVQGSEQDAQVLEASARQKQRDWLRSRLQGLVREDLIQKAGIEAEVAKMLKDVSFGDEGLNIDGLHRLAKESLAVQKAAVSKFVDTSQTSVNIKNPTAWLIGIIKKEHETAVKEAEKEAKKLVDVENDTRKQAAMKRPVEGWDKSDGRKLEEVKVGERLRGEVMNVFRGRVWVSCGLAKDATFTMMGGTYNVGDKLDNLKVTNVDLEKKWVEVMPVSDTAVNRQAPVSALPSRKVVDSATTNNNNRNNNDQRVGSNGFKDRMKAAAKPPKWKEAASPRPKDGWSHEGAKQLAELQVGAFVEGKITNVLHNRVWVNIGAEKDASVFAPEGKFKVGDVVSRVKVISVDLDKKMVRVALPEA